MSTIHFHQTTTLTPEQFIAGLTDFGPDRSKVFANSADAYLQLHHQGPRDADVTEGSRGVWERLHYDWSDPNQVRLTTTDSNVFDGASGYTYTLTRQPNATTDVDVVVVREGQEHQGTGARGPARNRRQARIGKGVCQQRQGHRSPQRRERGAMLVAGLRRKTPEHLLGELIQALRDGAIMFSKMWASRHSMAPLVIAAALTAAACTTNQPTQQHNSDTVLPLRAVGEIALPGDNSRFDYASLDSQRGLLFIAHLGASEVVEVDVHSGQVVRTIPNVAQVHGVLVVPPLNRVYATATGANHVVALDETTGGELGRASTDEYPDGLAFDPRRNTIWTTNESAGTETVVDAATMQPRGSVDLGGQVGNVAYDQDSDRMFVAVQGRDDLAVIDPEAMTVVRRVALPGCNHPHGLSIDAPDRLVFVACDQNATLVTVDQTNWNIMSSNPVGDDPDVLAFDSAGRRLYVAAESGTVTTLDLHDHSLAVSGSGHLANGAHVVAVDITTHRSYYPVPSGTNGHPALLEREPM